MHPLTGEKIPIYIADYVLMGYGTGAIMAVPAHDERDYEFARKFNLPIKVVVTPAGWFDSPCGCRVHQRGHRGQFASDRWPDDGGGKGERSSRCWTEKEVGHGSVNYKLRDWLFSRQRYWGEPFPIVWMKRATPPRCRSRRCRSAAGD
jgi:leucyl-tRNA synthetase